MLERFEKKKKLICARAIASVLTYFLIFTIQWLVTLRTFQIEQLKLGFKLFFIK